ncbi:uncharacterized protein V1518DRAFT_412602 [Limtongia smithiae]|uniref:uncharacterized protein n=1 Tax=Limtongia smithiae TaxID=1125753 RepID=UPI0034CD8ACF
MDVVDSALAANLAGIGAHHHHMTLSASVAANSSVIDPSIGMQTTDPEDMDPKKTCIFCQKTFSHPGSLGRHLDLKRGTRLHPSDAVDELRGDVKRRGDIVEIKARRARRAKEYNARDEVKERAKLRRKEKDRSQRARDEAKINFLNRLGAPMLPPHPSFPYMVLYFLPPPQWPHDPPTQETYNQLTLFLDPSMHLGDDRFNDWSSKAKVAYDNWLQWPKSKRIEVWNRELRSAAESALGASLTLYDLGRRDEWLMDEEKRISELDSLL